MDHQVDAYIAQSQGWPVEMTQLRPILLGCGLTEALKWRKPCYAHDGSNIVIMQEMKDHLSLMFFKGALLRDPAGVLEAQGPNSRSAMRICFRSPDDVVRLADTVRAYVAEAIDVERAGLEVEPRGEVAFCAELQARLAADDVLRAAFERLTPGRQREYDLYISGAKQAATRESRIDKYVPKILAGKGFRDR